MLRGADAGPEQSDVLQTQQVIGYGQCTGLADYLSRKVGVSSTQAAAIPLIGDAIRLDGWPQPSDLGPVTLKYSLYTACRTTTRTTWAGG